MFGIPGSAEPCADILGVHGDDGARVQITDARIIRGETQSDLESQHGPCRCGNPVDRATGRQQHIGSRVLHPRHPAHGYGLRFRLRFRFGKRGHLGQREGIHEPVVGEAPFGFALKPDLRFAVCRCNEFHPDVAITAKGEIPTLDVEPFRPFDSAILSLRPRRIGDAPTCTRLSRPDVARQYLPIRSVLLDDVGENFRRKAVVRARR
ncbi:MAG: hypothetical protein BWY63_02802 [Chloroflexi bacterium ADurb.Bin360]|nr:MAG: hypothetical protein BWY63_02802 [Chloroflexi bacterium ADurb.Bin360]